MAGQIIDVPGQGQVEFPDGMADADIVAAIKKMSPSKAAGGAANLLTGPDAMAAFGSGMAAGPISGLGGLAGAVLPGPEGQGADWQRRIAETLSYKPRTQGGELLTKAAAVPFDLLHKGAVALGQKAQDAGASPGVATAVQTATEVLPTMLLPGAASKGGGALVEAPYVGAKSLMRQALNPPKKAVLGGEADSAILTMLKEGVLPTKGGLEKLRAEIDTVNDAIAQSVQGSNATVNKMAVAKVMQDRLDSIKKQVNPNADVALLQKSWLEFVNHPLLNNSNLMPVQLAQELKQGTYRAIGSKGYGELKTADIENQKALARGLKDEVARAVPGISELNARDSALIDASNVLENRLATTGNRGLGVGALSPSGGNLLAWLVDHSDAAKGSLAQLLYKGSRPSGMPQGLLEGILASEQAKSR